MLSVSSVYSSQKDKVQLGYQSATAANAPHVV